MKVLTIASIALRRMFRDKVALFFVLAFPLLITFFIGTAIFSDSGAAGSTAEVGLVVEDESRIAGDLVSEIERIKLLEIVRFDDASALRKEIRGQRVDAGIVIPADYGDKLSKGAVSRVTYLAPSTDPSTPVRSAVAAVVTEQGALVKAAVFASKTSGVSFEDAMRRAEGSTEDPSQAKVGVEIIGRKRATSIPQGFRYPAASNLTLFVFLTSLAGAGTLVEARRMGITTRVFSTPTSTRTIMLGESLGRFSIAAFQGLFIFAAGALLFRIEWGNSLGAIALIAGLTLVGTAMGMIFGSILKTPEVAGALGPTLGIAMGMLGGCMWPLEIVPPFMRTIGHLTPHGWAMDGWIDLVGRGESAVAVLGEVAALGVFALILLPIGVWRLRAALLR